MLERMRLNVQRYEPMFVVGEPVPPPGGFEDAEWEAMVATITIASSPEVLAVIDEAHAKFASFRERGSPRASIARIAMASARHDRHPHALDLGDERAAVVGEPRDLQQRPARHRNDVTDDTRWRRVQTPSVPLASTNLTGVPITRTSFTAEVCAHVRLAPLRMPRIVTIATITRAASVRADTADRPPSTAARTDAVCSSASTSHGRFWSAARIGCYRRRSAAQAARRPAPRAAPLRQEGPR
jgi:hypothetical protein